MDSTFDKFYITLGKGVEALFSCSISPIKHSLFSRIQRELGCFSFSSFFTSSRGPSTISCDRSHLGRLCESHGLSIDTASSRPSKSAKIDRGLTSMLQRSLKMRLTIAGVLDLYRRVLASSSRDILLRHLCPPDKLREHRSNQKQNSILAADRDQSQSENENKSNRMALSSSLLDREINSRILRSFTDNSAKNPTSKDDQMVFSEIKFATIAVRMKNSQQNLASVSEKAIFVENFRPSFAAEAQNNHQTANSFST